MKKIIGIVASPRKGKSTKYMMEQAREGALEAATIKKHDLEFEIIELAGKKIGGCISCNKCKKGVLCSQQDDFQPILKTLADPELAGLIIATPVYMGCMSAQAKAFIDRTVVLRRNGFMLRDVVGGVVTIGGSRNGGQELTCQAVHAGMMIHDMIVVGDGGHFGGAAWANVPGGYEVDNEGIETAKMLGKKVAETIIRLK